MNYSLNDLKLYFAPLEGITYPQYRRIHHRIFGGVNCYYSPFIPTGTYDNKFLYKRFPDKDYNVPLIPQIIANDALKFLETVKTIKDFGYDEVNLNVGCPSATVFSKFKGSGMLRDLTTLNSFFDKVFENSQSTISVKTRMGIASVSEFCDILPIYNMYKISLLTIHARSRAGMYSSDVDLKAFSDAFYISKNTVSYNGDIFSSADLDLVIGCVPELSHVTIGRGAVANPALFRILRGGDVLSRNELSLFLDELINEYLEDGISPAFTTGRIKELWSYMKCLFPGCEHEYKNIKKAQNLGTLKAAMNSLIGSCEFDGSAHFISY